MKNVRLLLARTALAMSQFQLAERVGMKEWEVSRIETGRKTPTREEKIAIAQVLGKPTFEIFDA